MTWFTEAINNHVGRLDPSSGKIRFFNLPGPANQFMELASDAHGIIWITSFNEGLLTSLDPRTGTFIPYYAPATPVRGIVALYRLPVSPRGAISVTIAPQNLLS